MYTESATGAVELRRPFDVEVDWADDGLLLIPSAATVGTGDVGELLGHTRATLLAAPDRPRTTAELGRGQALAAALTRREREV